MTTAAPIAFGLTCGVGSMLIGAREAGFNVAGNIEWRKYYSRPDHEGRVTFMENFPGAILGYALDEMDMDEITSLGSISLAMGHPECGAWSTLNAASKNFHSGMKGTGDIPLFVDMVAKLRPDYVVMDDLPKSFIGFPPSEYHARLPDYDLYFEWVSNWAYGNIQKFRNRLFLVAAKKRLGYVFVPGERKHDLVMRDVIGDLLNPETLGRVPNHLPHENTARTSRVSHTFYRDFEGTWDDLALALQLQRSRGNALEYFKEDGTQSARLGTYMGYWDAHSHVLTGGTPLIHPLRGCPISIRERARIQGFPDDFIFYSERTNEHGEWNHDHNVHVLKMTGKAMPIHFNRYVARHIRQHMNTGRVDAPGATNTRVQRPNSYVDDAKRWYCTNVGYSNQDAACAACWLRDACTIRSSPHISLPGESSCNVQSPSA